jgi:transposase
MKKTKERIYMWYKVKELRGQGLSKSRISRDLGLDRGTVGKYLKISEDEFQDKVLSGRRMPKKLQSYLDYVKQELEQHSYLSAAQIEDRLKEHYADLPQVHSKTVYNFVQYVRCQFGIKKPKASGHRDFAQLPDLPYGNQAQVDFGECTMQSQTGGRIKVYFFVMVLSRSRYKFVYFQSGPFTTRDAIYAHLLAFEYFEGIPQEILYDQDSVFIHDENLGDYLLTHDFRAFTQSQPFEAVFCRKSDPQSKGKVENVVGYVKKNFLRGRTFQCITVLNQESLLWLRRTANAKIHGSTFKSPVKEWELEKHHLQKVKDQAVKPANELITYNVRKDNTVAYRGNFYTLPLGTYQDRKTTILLGHVEDQLNLYSMDMTLLTTHQLSNGKGNLVRNTDHRRDKSGTSAQVEEQACLLLGSDQKAGMYLDLLKKDKPRYYHDNLRAIIKGTKQIPAQLIRQSLDFCLENGLYNGAGFCQVAMKYQKMSLTQSNPKINLAIGDTSVRTSSAEMSVQTSNIKTYENLIGSWNR